MSHLLWSATLSDPTDQRRTLILIPPEINLFNLSAAFEHHLWFHCSPDYKDEMICLKSFGFELVLYGWFGSFVGNLLAFCGEGLCGFGSLVTVITTINHILRDPSNLIYH